jgi:signal transduction histidine kinase
MPLRLRIVPLIESDAARGALILLRPTSPRQNGAGEQQTSLQDATDVSPEQVIQWTASVAHEIRNPLSAIGNCIEILDKQLQPEGDSKELIEIALSECERLDRVLSNLLNFARRKEPLLQPAAVHELIERIAAALQYDTRFLSSMTLVRDFQAPLEQVLRIDKDQVKQVLWNLLINAVQAMPEGGELKVTTWIETNQWFCLSVQDSGIGMSPEVVQKALQPFFTTKVSGTGLGLATAKQIMERHGGQLEIESEQGKGTTAILRLPLPDKSSTG